MLKLLALLLSVAYAQTALPPQYLIHKDQPACLQRSKQQCEAMGCDGVGTIYWWDCSTGPLTAGVIGSNPVPAGSYGMTIEQSGAHGSQGLTAEEQKNLVTSTQIAPILPPPPPTFPSPKKQ